MSAAQAVPGVAAVRDDTRMRLAVIAMGLVALLLLSVLANGYVFGDNFSGDVALINRILDSSYLSQDWFVNISSGLNVRSIYSYGMAGLAAVFGIEGAYLLVYLAGLCLLGVAIWRLSLAIWPEAGVALLVVLVVLYTRVGELGSSQIMSEELASSFLAFGLIVFAAYFLLKRRYIAAAVLVAAAGLLHPLVGPEAGGLLCGALFMSLPGSERPRFIRHAPLLAVAITLAVVIGYLIKQGSGQAVDQVLLREIIAWQRIPWHHLPTSWPLDWWVNFTMFMLLVLVARARSGAVPFLDWLMVGVGAFCLIVMISFIVPSLATMFILQPFRMTILIQLAGILYIARYCWSLLRVGAWLPRAAALLLLSALVLVPSPSGDYLVYVALAICAFELIFALARRYHYPAWSNWLAAVPVAIAAGRVLIEIFTDPVPTNAGPRWIACGSILLALGVGYVLMNQQYRKIMFAASALLSLGSLAVLAVAWLNPMLPSWLSSWVTPLQMRLPYSDPAGDLALHARAGTPADALIIVAPKDAGTFRLEAERSVIADYISVPFKDQEIIEWRNRIYDLSGGPLPLGWTWKSQLTTAYARLNADQFSKLAQKYGATYVVVARSKKLNFPLVYQNTKFSLYQIPRASSGNILEEDRTL